MNEWPLAFKLRAAGVAAVVVLVLAAVFFFGGDEDPELFPVPVASERWVADRPVGGWAPIEAHATVAALAAPLSEFAVERVAAVNVPAGTIVTRDMLRPVGSAAVGEDSATVWITADLTRWHGGAAAGEAAVFSQTPGGCAALELVLADVEGSQVAVEATPELFATLVEGEPWTLWASPVEGWAEQCPADLRAAG